MKKDRARNSKNFYIDVISLLVMAVLLVVVFVNRGRLSLGKTYEFKTVAAAFYGIGSNRYVIDNGKSSIEFITADNVVSKRLDGGSEERFYYAQGVAERKQDSRSALYISDTAYITTEDGTVEENRVIEYSQGKYRKLYSAGEDRIFEIKTTKDGLFVLKSEESGIALIKVGDDGKAEVVQREYCGDILNGASADIETGCIAIAAKRGALRIIQKGSGQWKTLSAEGEHILPGAICAGGGKVYFSDFAGGRVCVFDQSDTGSYETVYSEDDLKINSIGLSDDGCDVLCCDLISFYEINNTKDGGISADYVDKLDYSGFYITWLLWAALAVSALLLIRFMRFAAVIASYIVHNEAALRMTAVIIAVVSVSCFIAWTLITEEHSNEDEWDVSSMKLFTDLVVDNIDVDLLRNLKSETDYAGSSYVKLRDRLDLLMAEASEEGRDYYYVIYDVENGRLRYLLNYYDSVLCTEPFGKMDDTYYKSVFDTQNSYALKSKDADGLWLYVLTPVVDSKGNCAAVLEIGTDLSFRTAERRSQTINVILSVFCSSAVMVMFIVEALLLIGFYEKRAKLSGKEEKDVTKLIPLRGIILFSYAAATIQDSFITVLAAKLYTGFIPFISEEIAAGLPLTLNLLMMAVFAAVGGHLEEKLGTKKVMLVGLLIEMAGFIICVITGNYVGLLIGNTLAGIGLGLINVVCNTIAAMGEGTEGTAAAFADVMAGILSGLTIGAGLASLLYPLGGSRLSYSAATALMVPVFFLVSNCIDVRTDEEDDDGQHVVRIGFGEFFFDKKVLGFLALVLVPFMTSVSYREYFYPMFAAENGVAEARTGQLYMICGLLVIYVGPHISAYVIERFGTYWSIIIASAAMGVNMLLFVIFPGMATAVLGMIMLSAITSFAYTCQYTYFEQLPESIRYGDGKSMGVYSVFENLGQTIGPTVYGILLSLGYRTGIGVFCAIMLLLAFLYVAMTVKGQPDKRGDMAT